MKLRRAFLAVSSMCVATALACTPQQEVSLVTVLPVVNLRDSPSDDGSVLATVRLGAPLKGLTPPRFWESKEHWRIKLNDGRNAFVPLGSAAQTPIPVVEMFVVKSFAARLPEAYAQGRVLDRHPIGTKVTVAREQPWLPPGFGAWMRDGHPAGYVLLDELGDEAPTAATSLEHARTALAELAFDAALQHTEDAWRLAPNDKTAGQAYAAMLEALDDPRAAQVRKTVGKEAPLPTPQPETVIDQNMDGYVAAALAPLRRAPYADSPAITLLGINTRVTVKYVEKGFAFVQWRAVIGPPAVVRVDPGDDGKTGGGEPLLKETQISGHIDELLLETRPVDLRSTRKRVDDELKEEHFAVATALLERALALDPGNTKTAQKLLETALKWNHFGVAASAAKIVSGQVKQLGPLDVHDLELVYGCRGELQRATVASADDKELSNKPRANACLRDVDVVGGCPLCETAVEDKTPVELFDYEMLKWKDAERLRLASATEEDMRREKALGDRLSRIKQLYPDGNYCHIRLRNRSGSRLGAGQALQVYNVREKAEGSGERLKVTSVSLPAVGAQQFVDVWLKTDGYAGLVCGVISARSSDAAKKALARHHPLLAEKDEKGSLPPHHEVSIRLPRCDCWGAKPGSSK